MAEISSSGEDAAPFAPPPSPPAAEGHGGGADNDVYTAARTMWTFSSDTFSPLLDLLQRCPDLFEQRVQVLLDPIDLTFLAQAGVACRSAVAACDLPRAGLQLRNNEWRVTHRLREFCTSAERLAWAKASGCPWIERTCSLRRRGRESGGAAMGAILQLPVGCDDVCIRSSWWASGGAAVGAAAGLPVGLGNV
jgi:hypothetical protein